MIITNIQTLSDRDYAKIVPDPYVVNVKAVEMKKCVVQIAPRNENDRHKVYHIHTDKFEETHDNVATCSVEYVITPKGYTELTPIVEAAAGLNDVMTEITGRMFNRTQKRALQLEAEIKKNRREEKKSKKEAGIANESEEAEVSEEAGISEEAETSEEANTPPVTD